MASSETNGRPLGLVSPRAKSQNAVAHAHRDPAERARMDVGKQRLAVEVDEIGPVQDADDHGEGEEEECGAK